MFGLRKNSIPRADGTPRTGGAPARSGAALRQRGPPRAALPGRQGARPLRPRCFLGAERKFLEARASIHVGGLAGVDTEPTYEEAAAAHRSHEFVRVSSIPGHQLREFEDLLGRPRPDAGHAPGNDVGTQYRSAIYCYGLAQLAAAQPSSRTYQPMLTPRPATGRSPGDPRGPCSTTRKTITSSLAKNPWGYCGSRHGVSCRRAWCRPKPPVIPADAPRRLRALYPSVPRSTSSGSGRPSHRERPGGA